MMEPDHSESGDEEQPLLGEKGSANVTVNAALPRLVWYGTMGYILILILIWQGPRRGVVADNSDAY